MARDAWAEAAEAHRHGRDAARRLFALQSARRHKEDWLRQASDLSIDAMDSQHRGVIFLLGAARSDGFYRAICAGFIVGIRHHSATQT